MLKLGSSNAYLLGLPSSTLPAVPLRARKQAHLRERVCPSLCKNLQRPISETCAAPQAPSTQAPAPPAQRSSAWALALASTTLFASLLSTAALSPAAHARPTPAAPEAQTQTQKARRSKGSQVVQEQATSGPQSAVTSAASIAPVLLALLLVFAFAASWGKGKSGSSLIEALRNKQASSSSEQDLPSLKEALRRATTRAQGLVQFLSMPKRDGTVGGGSASRASSLRSRTSGALLTNRERGSEQKAGVSGGTAVVEAPSPAVVEKTSVKEEVDRVSGGGANTARPLPQGDSSSSDAFAAAFPPLSDLQPSTSSSSVPPPSLSSWLSSRAQLRSGYVLPDDGPKLIPLRCPDGSVVFTREQLTAPPSGAGRPVITVGDNSALEEEIMQWSRIIQRGDATEAADTIRAAQQLAEAVLQVLEGDKASTTSTLSTLRNNAASVKLDSSDSNSDSSEYSSNIIDSLDSLEGFYVQATNTVPASKYSGVAQLVDWLTDLPKQVEARERLLQQIQLIQQQQEASGASSPLDGFTSQAPLKPLSAQAISPKRDLLPPSPTSSSRSQAFLSPANAEAAAAKAGYILQGIQAAADAVNKEGLQQWISGVAQQKEAAWKAAAEAEAAAAQREAELRAAAEREAEAAAQARAQAELEEAQAAAAAAAAHEEQRRAELRIQEAEDAKNREALQQWISGVAQEKEAAWKAAAEAEAAAAQREAELQAAMQREAELAEQARVQAVLEEERAAAAAAAAAVAAAEAKAAAEEEERQAAIRAAKLQRQQEYSQKLEAEWVERRAAWSARELAEKEEQRKQLAFQEQEAAKAIAAAKAKEDARRAQEEAVRVAEQQRVDAEAAAAAAERAAIEEAQAQALAARQKAKDDYWAARSVAKAQAQAAEAAAKADAEVKRAIEEAAAEVRKAEQEAADAARRVIEEQEEAVRRAAAAKQAVIDAQTAASEAAELALQEASAVREAFAAEAAVYAQQVSTFAALQGSAIQRAVEDAQFAAAASQQSLVDRRAAAFARLAAQQQAVEEARGWQPRVEHQYPQQGQQAQQYPQQADAHVPFPLPIHRWGSTASVMSAGHPGAVGQTIETEHPLMQALAHRRTAWGTHARDKMDPLDPLQGLVEREEWQEVAHEVLALEAVVGTVLPRSALLEVCLTSHPKKFGAAFRDFERLLAQPMRLAKVHSSLSAWLKVASQTALVQEGRASAAPWKQQPVWSDLRGQQAMLDNAVNDWPEFAAELKQRHKLLHSLVVTGTKGDDEEGSRMRGLAVLAACEGWRVTAASQKAAALK